MRKSMRKKYEKKAKITAGILCVAMIVAGIPWVPVKADTLDENVPEYVALQQAKAAYQEAEDRKNALQAEYDAAKKVYDGLAATAASDQAIWESYQVIADEKFADYESAQIEYNDAVQESEDCERILQEYPEEIENKKTELAALNGQVTDLADHLAQEKSTYTELSKDETTAKSAWTLAVKNFENGKTDTEKKMNTRDFFTWIASREDIDEDVRTDALLGAELLAGEINEESEHYRDLMNVAGNELNINRTSKITYEELLTYTDLKDETDATSLSNMKSSLEWINTGNHYRALENLPELKVSYALMAMSELDINYVTNVFEHTGLFYALENLAMVSTGGDGGENITVECQDDNPYTYWYVEEKENYDSQNGGQTGHYITLTDRQLPMKITGFAVKDMEETTDYTFGTTVYPITFYYRYYGQMFSDSDHLYDVTTGITTSECLNAIEDYEVALSDELKALEEEMDSAEAVYLEKKALAEEQKEKLDEAQEAYDTNNDEIETLQKDINRMIAELAEAKTNVVTNPARIQAAKERLDAAKEVYEAALAETVEPKKKYDNSAGIASASKSVCDKKKEALDAADQELTLAKEELEACQAAYDLYLETGESQGSSEEPGSSAAPGGTAAPSSTTTPSAIPSVTGEDGNSGKDGDISTSTPAGENRNSDHNESVGSNGDNGTAGDNGSAGNGGNNGSTGSNGKDENNSSTGNSENNGSAIGTITLGGVTYKILSVATREAVVVPSSDAAGKSKGTSLVVRDQVTIDGVKYQITSIENGAFAKYKKLKKVVIGKNVRRIGKKAFFKCKSLKKIILKGKKISKVGKKAFKGIHKKAKFKYPKKAKKFKKKFRKLLKKSR